MQDKTFLLAALQENTEILSSVLTAFSRERFNRRPDNGGWTAGQLGEHLLIFDRRLNMLLDHAVHTTERDPLEKLSAITAKVSNREERIEAPPFLVPSDNEQDPLDIVEKIIAERKKVAEKINTNDLTLLNTADPHRFYGDLTGMEWINLILLHTQRHLPQLQKLI